MAVYEMMWSLGQRFDYYLLPDQTKAEHERHSATVGGIGLVTREKNVVKAIRALGPNPTEAQVEPLLKISDHRPLVAAETPDADSPAGKAHLAEGDRIVEVDGESVNGKTLQEVVSKIRGAVGTQVTLLIVHTDATGQTASNIVALTRAKVILHVVKTDYQGNIAHIRLKNFDSQFGTKELRQALESAAKNNASAVLLDLRGNPGGNLDQVLEMAQLFIDQGVILKQVKRVGDHMVTVTDSVTASDYVVSTQSDDGSPATEKRHVRLPAPLLQSARLVRGLADCYYHQPQS
jgi:C-terminal peptidase prc